MRLGLPTGPEMRVEVFAGDLRVGDVLPGVGKVTSLTRDSDTVAITLDWATVDVRVLSPDHVVYIDKPEPKSGAA